LLRREYKKNTPKILIRIDKLFSPQKESTPNNTSMSLSPSSPLKERYNNAKEILLQIPGVVSVSLGYKQTGKDLTDQFGLRVYVQQKKSAADVPATEMIPGKINGLTTDVVQAFEGTALS
jgi:hypothetical protein